jgi:hypothetical protein
MAIRERFTSVGGAAFVATLLQAGAASAHAGEPHAPGGLDGTGGVALVAVVIAVVVAHWLTSRAARLPRQATRESESQ